MFLHQLLCEVKQRAIEELQPHEEPPGKTLTLIHKLNYMVFRKDVGKGACLLIFVLDSDILCLTVQTIKRRICVWILMFT